MASLSTAAQRHLGTEFTGCSSIYTAPTASTLLIATHAFQVLIMVTAGANYLPPSKVKGAQGSSLTCFTLRTKEQSNWLLCILLTGG